MPEHQLNSGISSLATWQWLDETDKTMRHSVQRRLHSFIIDLEALQAALDGGKLLLAALERHVPILSAVTDPASWQVMGSSILKDDSM